MKAWGVGKGVLLVGALVLAVGVPSSVSARRPARQALTFVTAGSSCNAGVCSLASGNVGASYGQNLVVSGGSGGPIGALPVFTVVAGSLAPGLVLARTYGCCGTVIGGTSTAAGTFDFTVQARDGAGDTARQAFSIVIAPAARLTITFPATCCAAGTIGGSYLQNFFLAGGVGPYTASIASGQLPPGLRLSASPPISITGTPTARGTYTFAVQVTDSTGARAIDQGTITIGRLTTQP
jgi:large repetitive protein